jgi:hypothetical protein
VLSRVNELLVVEKELDEVTSVVEMLLVGPGLVVDMTDMVEDTADVELLLLDTPELLVAMVVGVLPGSTELLVEAEVKVVEGTKGVEALLSSVELLVDDKLGVVDAAEEVEVLLDNTELLVVETNVVEEVRIDGVVLDPPELLVVGEVTEVELDVVEPGVPVVDKPLVEVVDPVELELPVFEVKCVAQYDLSFSSVSLTCM